MKLLASLLLAGLLLAGCAITGGTFGSSPEEQIRNGANSVAAGAALGTVLLKNNKITVTQAKSYSAILHTAGDHMTDAGNRLFACRGKTGSKPDTRPDPCAATVADDIALGISIANDVKKVMDAKQ